MADEPIIQPIEGSHAPKADVSGPIPTSATAGEDKAEPADGEHHYTGEASLEPETVDYSSAESAGWEPDQ